MSSSGSLHSEPIISEALDQDKIDSDTLISIGETLPELTCMGSVALDALHQLDGLHISAHTLHGAESSFYFVDAAFDLLMAGALLYDTKSHHTTEKRVKAAALTASSLQLICGTLEHIDPTAFAITTSINFFITTYELIKAAWLTEFDNWLVDSLKRINHLNTLIASLETKSRLAEWQIEPQEEQDELKNEILRLERERDGLLYDVTVRVKVYCNNEALGDDNRIVKINQVKEILNKHSSAAISIPIQYEALTSEKSRLSPQELAHDKNIKKKLGQAIDHLAIYWGIAFLKCAGVICASVAFPGTPFVIMAIVAASYLIKEAVNLYQKNKSLPHNLSNHSMFRRNNAHFSLENRLAFMR